VNTPDEPDENLADDRDEFTTDDGAYLDSRNICRWCSGTGGDRRAPCEHCDGEGVYWWRT
jgi:hypothetical protein